MKLSAARIVKRLVGVGVIICVIFMIEQLSKSAKNQESRPTLELDSMIWKPEGKRIYAHALIDKEIAFSGYENYTLDDPWLIKFIKSFILPPSSEPYNLNRENVIDFSRGQSPLIDAIFSKKKGGYFVEIGAGDGEKESISLYFEKERDWRGLLVEPNTKHYENLVSKHRKSHTLNACVQTNSTNSKKAFLQFNPERKGYFVPCFSIESILLATDRDYIDLLTFDIDGQEMSLLQQLPHRKIYIRVISTELHGISQIPRDLLSMMDQNGYKAQHQFVNHVLQKTDLIFVRQEVFKS
ncbi:hypothetical protein ACJMK2_019248 [Sinanodonta woodiana]|uniref:Methyltransferase FkbM domain-containing protein n=1 Tax=Sinanodonta woodiana TaxID=1069815 RepID=A0ABD3UJV2_SINWO